MLPEEVRKLAYDYAEIFKMPNIAKNQWAGTAWLTGFIKRNYSLSIRTPELTRYNVNYFKLNDILIKRNGSLLLIGTKNSSEWMTATEFLTYIDHYIQFTKRISEKPLLLLLDNHSPHVEVDEVEKVEANSFIILSFPSLYTN